MNPPAENNWTAAAGALQTAFPPARWPERLRTWLVAESTTSEPWCVALSGGADSVAVLLTLAAMRGELRKKGEGRMQNGGEAVCLPGGQVPQSGRTLPPTFLPETRNPKPETRGETPLVALHFNHRLRGAAADADEAFCRALCAALEVKLIVGAASWPAGSAVSEAEARAARFSFFGDTMAKLGARALWLGHQRDDVVETMLLRLSRGSGARGLAAPRPVQRLADGTVRLRPLLDVPKAEIVAALRGAGVAWCEDETNHGDAYFRNRLRRQVVPAWAAAAQGPCPPAASSVPLSLAECFHDRENILQRSTDLSAAVARSRALLEEEDEALELWADRLLPARLGEGLPLAPLREAPVAVTRRALHRWLQAAELGENLSRVAVDELLRSVRSGGEAKVSVGDASFLVVAGGMVRLVAVDPIAPVWSERMLAVPGEVDLPGGAKLRATRVPIDPESLRRICAGELDDGRTAFLSAMETSARLSIRPWQPGDRYAPLGTERSTKLQDQFVNRRIPRELRQWLPVICAADGTIVWVPGLPPAHCARLTDGTMVAVQLTYLPPDSLSATRHVR